MTAARLDLGQPLARELLAAHIEARRLGELRERTPLPECLEHLLAKRSHFGVNVVCHAEEPHTLPHAHVRWRRVDAQASTRAVELERELLRLGALFGAAPSVLVLLVCVAARGALAGAAQLVVDGGEEHTPVNVLFHLVPGGGLHVLEDDELRSVGTILEHVLDDAAEGGAGGALVLDAADVILHLEVRKVLARAAPHE